MIDLRSFVKCIRITTEKHCPEILTGIGIAGMITAGVLAVKATPKALKLIDKKNTEKGIEKSSFIESAKASWKCYVPSVLTGTVSAACIIGARSVDARRNAALAAAYTLSESALKEYREKIVETFGEKKEKEVRDLIAKDKIDCHSAGGNEVICSGKGSTLCFDAYSSRYFYSDIDKVKKVVNELNRSMLNDDMVSLNDFYYSVGLSETKTGDDIGWQMADGFMELELSSILSENDIPCLVVDFRDPPKYFRT